MMDEGLADRLKGYAERLQNGEVLDEPGLGESRGTGKFSGYSPEEQAAARGPAFRGEQPPSHLDTAEAFLRGEGEKP